MRNPQNSIGNYLGPTLTPKPSAGADKLAVESGSLSRAAQHGKSLHAAAHPFRSLWVGGPGRAGTVRVYIRTFNYPGTQVLVLSYTVVLAWGLPEVSAMSVRCPVPVPSGAVAASLVPWQSKTKKEHPDSTPFLSLECATGLSLPSPCMHMCKTNTGAKACDDVEG